MEQLYKIKPLEFTDIGNGIHEAQIPDGKYRIFVVTEHCIIKYLWSYYGGLNTTEQEYCNSIEHGKELCQQHYEEQMKPNLIEV